MFAQIYRKPAARHLHEDRRIGLEAMLPLDFEAEKIEIELARFSSEKMRKMGTARWNSIAMANLFNQKCPTSQKRLAL